MQTIPDSYVQAGHPMKLVRREGNVAIYRAVGTDYWEVHRVRVRGPDTIKGREYPVREVLAGNEDFGTWGWACVSQERADGRFAGALAFGNAKADAEA
jgi:hypothetical protein